MAQLGAGLEEILGNISPTALSGAFDKAFAQMADDLYRRLRDDLCAEVRAEVQRQSNPQILHTLASVIGKLGQPQVHVAAPIVHVEAAPTPSVTIDVPEMQVDVHVPPAPAPMVVVERPKEQRIVHDGNGKIVGVKTV